MLIEEYTLRIDLSSEKDLKKLEIWKKDKRYHVFEMSFDENMAESRKVGEIKKMVIAGMFYLYIIDD